MHYIGDLRVFNGKSLNTNRSVVLSKTISSSLAVKNSLDGADLYSSCKKNNDYKKVLIKD